MRAALVTKQQLQDMGYLFVRQLPTGDWIGVYRFLYTTALLVGLDDAGYRTRFCYEHETDAIAAALIFDGTGDPPGPWIKEKGARERLGPGATEHP